MVMHRPNWDGPPSAQPLTQTCYGQLGDDHPCLQPSLRFRSIRPMATDGFGNHRKTGPLERFLVATFIKAVQDARRPII
jgi:hypothetical protein